MLTGDTRYRQSRVPFSNKLILQVEVAKKRVGSWPDGSVPPGHEYITSWRDAKVEDLSELQGGEQ